ncbi:MAG: TRAP transporter substrate-binding protein DctP [Myxococcales bacterium]|nr:TRAP transporter substrate-binding protein DctP [Myxococcales bacterium]
MRFRIPLLLALAALFAAPAAFAGKTKIKLATLAPKGSAYFRILTELADRWESLSGGSVELKIYPAGVAGADDEVVRKMRLGTLQAALMTTAGLREIDSAAHAFQIPLAYHNYEELDYVMGQMRAKVEQIYADKGFVVLEWSDGGWIRFLAKKPINMPSDAFPQKMFVFAGHPAQIELWKRAGFTVVPLPGTEITTALQTGLIEAVPTTAQAALLMQWNKHATYLTDQPISAFIGALVVKREVWESIDAGLREKLATAAHQAGDRLRAEARPKDDESIREMAARGLTLVKTTPEAKEAWRKTIDGAKDGIRGTFVPAELYDEAMALLESYRKSHP